MPKLLALYKKNYFVINFHLFLTFIYWVGFVYTYLSYQSVMKLWGVLLFSLLIYVVYIRLIGTQTLLIEMYTTLFGQECEALIVDYKKKDKLLIPLIRFRYFDEYQSLEHYRYLSFPWDDNKISVLYTKKTWISPELAYLKIKNEEKLYD